MERETELKGGCHCGNIRYRLLTFESSQNLPQRRCNCSFCRRHGAIYTADPSARLVIDLQKPDAVTSYRFSSKTVHFILCSECGVLTAAHTEIDGKTYAVVNANTLEIPLERSPDKVSFVTETPSEATARRKRNWIGHVVINS